jgi:type II secretory pathway pseudopilin PulG
MYKIRGGDGKEYGPVSADTLRAWVNQGRANAQTFVLVEGSTEWKTLSAVPEFAGLFAPPMPGMSGAVGGSPVSAPRTSAMAVVSLASGCVSVVSCGLTSLLTSPLGLILGLVSLSQIKKSGGRLTGRGLALAGTIISGVTLLLIPILIAMLLPALAKAKAKAQQIQCVNNAKQLGLAVRIYAADSNDKFPAATNWCDAILNNAASAKVFVCPGASNLTSGFAFNAKLSGLEEGTIDPSTVLIFESDAGWNSSGGKELMITRPRHANRYVIGLADGSVQQMTEAQVRQLRWNPITETNNPATP